MKNSKLIIALFSLGLGMSLSSTSIAGRYMSPEECDRLGIQCLVDDDDEACRIWSLFCPTTSPF